MSSNVISLFKGDRVARSGVRPALQPERTTKEVPQCNSDDDAQPHMIELSGLSEAEWDEVFGGSFLIF